MKKTLLSIAVLSMLTGCYEDKGSYDYHLDKMNEIKNISFIPATVTTISGKTVELQQPLTEDQTTGHIEVQLEQTLADNFDNLDFFWYLSYTKDEKQVKDTIRTKGYLDVLRHKHRCVLWFQLRWFRCFRAWHFLFVRVARTGCS